MIRADAGNTIDSQTAAPRRATLAILFLCVRRHAADLLKRLRSPQIRPHVVAAVPLQKRDRQDFLGLSPLKGGLLGRDGVIRQTL